MDASDGRAHRPDLPTRSPPTGPPSAPTDSFGEVRVVGTVVADGHDGCAEVRDANGVRWALVGPGADDLVAGDRVSATGQAQPEPERSTPGPCAGAPVRVRRITRMQ